MGKNGKLLRIFPKTQGDILGTNIANIFIELAQAQKVLNLTIGMLTPPFGVGLYTVATVGKEAPHKVLKELLPLYVPLLIALMVVTYVPGLTMWLPSLL